MSLVCLGSYQGVLYGFLLRHHPTLFMVSVLRCFMVSVAAGNMFIVSVVVSFTVSTVAGETQFWECLRRNPIYMVSVYVCVYVFGRRRKHRRERSCRYVGRTIPNPHREKSHTGYRPPPSSQARPPTQSSASPWCKRQTAKTAKTCSRQGTCDEHASVCSRSDVYGW